MQRIRDTDRYKSKRICESLFCFVFLEKESIDIWMWWLGERFASLNLLTISCNLSTFFYK